MTKRKKLSWGETPWDHMSKEQLLLEVWRLYAALKAVDPTGERDFDISHSKNIEYWTTGRGAKCVEMVQQALDSTGYYQDEELSDELYRSFFRYTDDLLFHSTSSVQVGWNWHLCPEGHMTAGDGRCPLCGKPVRKLSWQDLRPEMGVTV